MSRKFRTKAAPPPPDDDAISDDQIRGAIGSMQPVMEPLAMMMAALAQAHDLPLGSPERSDVVDKYEANFTALWSALDALAVRCVRAALDLADDLESAEIAEKRATAEANLAMAEFFRKGL